MGVADAKAALPTGPGVYRFRDARGHVLYIGRATNLRRRVDSYWGDLGDRPHLKRMVPRIAGIEAVACDSAHEAAWLERNLLERTQREHGLPRWNRTPGGQEVPAYIRVDARSGLQTVHCAQSGTRHFGPYLGGARVRLAVSGLHRVLPLDYTGDRLAGSAREMARVRGVDGTDRTALVATVTAVLDRDPGTVEAVRRDLVRRRDSAAASLAFELAARIHEEIEALDWVASTQRAALPEPADFDVYGWAGSVLVHLEMRAGLLCTWRTSRCSRHRGAALVEATPAPWAEFAARNADLAARLRQHDASA